MTKNARIELIRESLESMRELRRIGPAAAQWGAEADLEYMLACYDSIKALQDEKDGRNPNWNETGYRDEDA